MRKRPFGNSCIVLVKEQSRNAHPAIGTLPPRQQHHALVRLRLTPPVLCLQAGLRTSFSKVGLIQISTLQIAAASYFNLYSASRSLFH